MGDVERIPTQHKRFPHCPTCKRELPNFEMMQMLVSSDDMRGATLLRVTYRVACECGAEWDLAKNVVSNERPAKRE